MLRIQKGTSSNLIVTVTELTTVSPVFYLFEFEHEQSFLKYYCILPNLSTATSRYDEFLLVDGVDVNFEYDGYYTYRIYQQTSSTNLDPDLSDGLVEEGRAHVYEIDSPSTEFSTNITFNIYE
jgi:hypothetical protein